ncbi:MAG TPA: glycosyltransferase family 2 protein [bacterium]|nr:glycosyltransferase family 2 protein [bacterium]
MSIDPLPAVLVFASFGLVLYTYAGYPALLWLLAGLVPSRAAERREPARWPDVSVLLSAYNEELLIETRIRNLLELDYPVEHLEILIGSDGSTDRTEEIVRRWESTRLHLVAFDTRRGKASVINDLVARARGEIVVLTDANTFFQPDAVRELVRGFVRHPSACTVIGQVEYRTSAGSGNLDGMYMRYDAWIQTLESRFGCVLGAHGAIYAFPRGRYRPIPGSTIIDDFQIPLRIRLHGGGHAFCAPAAKAWERSPERVRDEFRRRVRFGAGGLQALMSTWPLLLPWKGMVALAYVSHKLLRWFGPWLMLVGFGANLWLLGVPFFRFLFLGQLAGGGLAVLAPWVRGVPVVGRAAVALRFFLVLNAALLLGFAQFARGAARPFWSRTPRQAVADGAPMRHDGAAALPPTK